jgi:hypothetical protein
MSDWPFNAIFRLWKSALKDDENLIDEAIAAAYDRMISIDPVRAEQVMSLIIRRHGDAKNALKDLLSQDTQRSCRNYNPVLIRSRITLAPVMTTPSRRSPSP